jgi:transcriptional regulator with XRE-family HTH domain
MNFGEKLKTLREERNLSQAELAKELGLAQTYVSALERRADLPRHATLELIAEYFRLPISSFKPPVSEEHEALKAENLRLKSRLRQIRKMLDELDID